MHREMKGAEGWGPGDVLGLSAKSAVAGAVTSSSKCSGCRAGRGKIKDAARPGVSREQQSFCHGTALPEGRG